MPLENTETLTLHPNQILNYPGDVYITFNKVQGGEVVVTSNGVATFLPEAEDVIFNPEAEIRVHSAESAILTVTTSVNDPAPKKKPKSAKPAAKKPAKKEPAKKPKAKVKK